MIISSSQIFRVAVLLCVCGQVAQAQTLHLTKRTIYDSGFGVKMASHTILAPSNWMVEGQGHWPNAKYYNNVPSQIISLKSADGFGIRIGPVTNASDGRITSTGAAAGYIRPPQYDAYMGRVVIYRPDTIAQWNTFYKQQMMPTLETGRDAELTEVFEIPELTAVIEYQLGPTKQNLEAGNVIYRQSNFEQSCDGIAVGFRTRYVENGRKMESLHVLMITTTYTRNVNYTQLDWNSVADVRLVAPEGQLESAMPQMVAIATSVRETPQWAQEKAIHLAKLFKTTLKGFAERSQIMADNHRDISNIIANTQRNIDASNARSHSKYIDAIREVETYSDGNSSYELPSGFDHVYSDGGGNFILTNDHLLNPNVDLDTNSNWSAINPNR